MGLENLININPEMERREFLELLGLIVTSTTATSCARVMKTVEEEIFDYKFIVVKDNKVYTLEVGIDSEEEKIAHSILVEKRYEIEQHFVPYMKPKEKTKFLNALYGKKPDGNVAAEIFERVLERNTELKKEAQRLGIEVKKYVDPNLLLPVYVLMLSGNIAFGFFRY